MLTQLSLNAVDSVSNMLRSLCYRARRAGSRRDISRWAGLQRPVVRRRILLQPEPRHYVLILISSQFSP
jgi:hypothetical protein